MNFILKGTNANLKQITELLTEFRKWDDPKFPTFKVIGGGPSYKSWPTVKGFLELCIYSFFKEAIPLFPLNTMYGEDLYSYLEEGNFNIKFEDKR